MVILMNNSKVEYQILDKMYQTRTPIGASYLCTCLNIPQASIGRVLQQLETRGLVEKVSNKGRILTAEGISYFQLLQQSINSQESVDILLDLFSKNDKQVYLDILEARISLEEKTAELAAQRATEDDIREIEEVLLHYQQVRAQGKPAEDENLAFHTKIAEVSKNTVLYHLLKLVMMENAAYLHFSYTDYAITGSTRVHFQIYEAIKNHNAPLAAALMRDHLSGVATSVQNVEYDQVMYAMSKKRKDTSDDVPENKE